MAGDTIQSKTLEDYVQEAREHTLEWFMKSHAESYFFVCHIPRIGAAAQKLAYATMAGGSLRDLDKKIQGPVVYEVTFDKISSGQSVWVGRTSNCMIQIDHPHVSKLQGYIKLDIKEKKIVYADTKSKNGSRIDDGRMLVPEREYPLNSGQKLQFGEAITLKFYFLPDFRSMLEKLK